MYLGQILNIVKMMPHAAEFHLFFGKIEETIICFQDLLTFKCLKQTYPRIFDKVSHFLCCILCVFHDHAVFPYASFRQK